MNVNPTWDKPQVPKALQETADLATDFSDGFYPLQFNDGLATATNIATGNSDG